MAAGRSSRRLFTVILVGLVLPDCLVSYILHFSYCVLRFSKSIINRAINPPGHRNDFFDGINETEKSFLKEKMKIIGKLASNYTSKIVIPPSDSKDVSIKSAYQCTKILKNK